MLISGSTQLKKGMLSVAVYVKLAQAYCQFQVTIRLGIKNRSWTALPYFGFRMLSIHSFSCICYICNENVLDQSLLAMKKNTWILNLTELISIVDRNNIISVLLSGKWQIFKNPICNVSLCHEQTSLLITIHCKLFRFQWSNCHKHVVSFRAWWT